MKQKVTRRWVAGGVLSAVAATIGSTATATPPSTSPEAVVRAYTEAANRGDLEAFLGLYDAAIRKYRFPGTLTSEGLEHNRQAYARSFAANPALRVEIVELMALGDTVVVRDRVTGLATGQAADELTVYRVVGGRIREIVYVERIVGPASDPPREASPSPRP